MEDFSGFLSLKRKADEMKKESLRALSVDECISFYSQNRLTLSQLNPIQVSILYIFYQINFLNQLLGTNFWFKQHAPSMGSNKKHRGLSQCSAGKGSMCIDKVMRLLLSK